MAITVTFTIPDEEVVQGIELWNEIAEGNAYNGDGWWTDPHTIDPDCPEIRAKIDEFIRQSLLARCETDKSGWVFDALIDFRTKETA